jgi:hypothetical protein
MSVNSVNGAAFPLSPNAIINGGFDIWQRGTTFTNPANASFVADRWSVNHDGSGATRAVSQQAITLGDIPGLINEPAFALRYSVTAAGSGNNYQSIQTRIEDVKTFAGKTVTLSFYAKASSEFSMENISFWQNFGSGGSSLTNVIGSVGNIGTSWARYSVTVNIPSISGKTIGSGSFLGPELYFPLASNVTVDFYGFQLEAGLVATPFRRNANSLQGELAACQRYYWRASDTSVQATLGQGTMYSTTQALTTVQLPVTMRTAPTSFEAANYLVTDSLNNLGAGNSISINQKSTDTVTMFIQGLSSSTQFRYVELRTSSVGGYIAFGAEL